MYFSFFYLNWYVFRLPNQTHVRARAYTPPPPHTHTYTHTHRVVTCDPLTERERSITDYTRCWYWLCYTRRRFLKQ
jgi:hypothetical protein